MESAQTQFRSQSVSSCAVRVQPHAVLQNGQLGADFNFGCVEARRRLGMFTLSGLMVPSGYC
jgi:hypothetical protein